jgi:hypothetical protein
MGVSVRWWLLSVRFIQKVIVIGVGIQLWVYSIDTYNGDRQVEIGLDEGNHFGSTLGCGDHQDILRVTQDGVVEQDAKEHQRQGKQLLALFGGRDHIL